MKYLSRISTIVICFFIVCSCATSRAVISNSVDISRYDYVTFGDETTGDRSLDDIVLLVQNEITDTRLQGVSSNDANSLIIAVKKVLPPNINVKSQYWDGGHTYITVTFYDFASDQQVLVLKSSGIGLTVPHDQKIALKAIRKKIQSTFGK